MKKIIGTMVALTVLAIFISSAQAVIKIEVSEVQNGVAFIKGNGAAKGAAITWEGFSVTTANKNNGGFSFFGILPDDCIGELSDGGVPLDVAVLNCAQAALAPVPKTGVTTSYAAGDDGALQKGVAWPNPRFTVNTNGTVTDNLTGLIWLKNANCPNTYREWATALTDVASLNSTGTMNGNDCGDTSNGGSHQTDWRLPNLRELFSLLDSAFFNPVSPNAVPAIPNTSGTGQGSSSDPFSNFVANDYWSSTTAAGNSVIAWVVDFGVGFGGGGIYGGSKTQGGIYIIAIRGGS